MKSNRFKRLISDSLLFAIGSIGTKMIMFIMVPVYTYYLATGVYGSVDIFLTTLTMLTPVATLSIFDAVFRFSMKNDSELSNSKIFYNGLAISLLGGVITIIIGMLLTFTLQSSEFLVFTVMLFLNTMLSLFQNYFRGIGRKRLFVFLGLLSTLVGAFSTIIFLNIRNDLNSVLFGNIIGLLIATIVSCVFSKVSLGLLRDNFQVVIAKKLLRYSIPLIPNSFAWWFTNDVARFVILFFVGTSGNGLYAVASKIPALLTVFFSIFSQAWQISAIKEYRSEDRDYFYSNVFNRLLNVSFVIVGIILFFIKPLLSIIIDNSYYSAWENVPALLIAAVFSNLSAFVGTTYIAAEKTSLIMYTTVLGMIINTVLTLILVPWLGIQGAGIGSAIGFFVVLIVRIINTKSLVAIKMNWIQLMLSLIIILFQSWSLWYLGGNLQVVAGVLSVVSILALNGRDVFNFKKRDE